MKLLIDIGNTRIKFGWIDLTSGERESLPLAIAHGELQRLGAWLAQLPRPADGALAVNVAGSAAAAALCDALPVPVRWVDGASPAAGLINGYDRPAQLGADRWAALIGLAAQAQPWPEAPLLLASFGTATTIDSLGPAGLASHAGMPHGSTAGHGAHALSTTEDAPPLPQLRRFVGGLILPGTELMRTALAGGTANLPLAKGSPVDFPANTDQAIASGIVAAQAGALACQWRLTLQRFGRPPRLYACGGAWPAVHQAVIRHLRLAHDDLDLPSCAIQTLDAPVLDGLARLAVEANRITLSSS